MLLQTMTRCNEAGMHKVTPVYALNEHSNNRWHNQTPCSTLIVAGTKMKDLTYFQAAMNWQLLALVVPVPCCACSNQQLTLKLCQFSFHLTQTFLTWINFCTTDMWPCSSKRPLTQEYGDWHKNTCALPPVKFLRTCVDPHLALCSANTNKEKSRGQGNMSRAEQHISPSWYCLMLCSKHILGLWGHWPQVCRRCYWLMFADWGPLQRADAAADRVAHQFLLLLSRPLLWSLERFWPCLPDSCSCSFRSSILLSLNSKSLMYWPACS